MENRKALMLQLQEIWHVQKDCRFKNEQIGFTDEKEDESNLFYACHRALEGEKNVWYLNSGCSNHMIRDDDAFMNMNLSFN